MRVCLIATEISGIGSYGGFGVLTLDVALGLAERGCDVCVVVPRQIGQRPLEHVSGIPVLSLECGLYDGFATAKRYAGVFTMLDADVYHSQEPSIATRVAMLGAPSAAHMITVQDPRELEDWRRQWAPWQRSWFDEQRFMFNYRREVAPGIREADAVYCQAKFVIDKAQRLFRMSSPPAFLPNPVPVSAEIPQKASTPTVCFIGRWDAIKRPELFLELAANFPHVRFILAGASNNVIDRQQTIARRAAALPNVETPGWITPEQRSRMLAGAWILVNTSTKECLPVTYLEAAASGCAILSHIDADEFPSRFGYWAKEGTVDDFSRGLAWLLAEDHWKALGRLGHQYVLETHEYHRVIDQHLDAYNALVATSPSPRRAETPA